MTFRGPLQSLAFYDSMGGVEQGDGPGCGTRPGAGCLFLLLPERMWSGRGSALACCELCLQQEVRGCMRVTAVTEPFLKGMGRPEQHWHRRTPFQCLQPQNYSLVMLLGQLVGQVKLFCHCSIFVSVCAE